LQILYYFASSRTSILPPPSLPPFPRSDEDEALTDEMEDDEFNHPHPATVVIHAPTPEGMNQVQVNEHVAYMQQELSHKEGASSEVGREGRREGGREGHPGG